MVVSPEVSGIIIAIISSIGSLAAKYFFDSLREARAGRKDEAQKIAAERDKYRTKTFQWKNSNYRDRAIAYQHAAEHKIPPPDFPPTPDD